MLLLLLIRLAGDPTFPGILSCFLTAGGVDDTLLKGRTGWTGADLEPIDLGSVWLLESVELAGRFPATVNFLPEARKK